MKKTKAEKAAMKFLVGGHPVLYIFMRSDLTSLNAGKAMAQASHAANAMVHLIKHGGLVPSKHIKNLLTKWENSTAQGFGTCLVLDCHNEHVILQTIDKLNQASKEVITDIINDPTYPVRDGDLTHYISLNTCGYAFFDKDDEQLSKILENFKLYK